MPAANVAVLYWTVSTIMWGKVVADTDAEIAAVQAHYASDPNTSVLLVPRAQPYDDASCRAAIATATGKPTPDDSCAVLDPSGNVLAVIKADAAMNDPARNGGAAHRQAPNVPIAVGDRWSTQNTRWERRYSVAPSALSLVVSSQAWLALVNPVPPVPGNILGPSSVPIGQPIVLKSPSSVSLA